MKAEKYAPRNPARGLNKTAIAIGVAASLAALSHPVFALEIKTGNPDLEVRWDNTVRYNAGWRATETDPRVVGGAAPSFSVGGTDEGNYTWGKGDMSLSRFDLYSELDVTYQKRLGLRVSGTAWYDNNFPDRTTSGNGAGAGVRTPGAPNYTNNEFTPYVKRYYQGPSGQFNDAFVWGNFDLGSTKLNLKAGRYAFLPGEYLMGNGGSVSFSMAPNDGQKSDLSPGANAKETAIPLGQVGATLQVTDAVTLYGNYSAEFRSSTISEAGTFGGVSDAGLNGPQWVVGSGIPRRAAYEGEKGDIALGVKFQPDWLHGDALGFWYRKFDDKNPTWTQQIEFVGGAMGARAVYAKDIELIGATYNTVLGDWGTGFELNYRKNMPLAMPSYWVSGRTPGYSDATLEGPRGDTLHFIASGVKLLNKNALFDSASLVLQLDYNRIQDITKHADRFNGAMSTNAASAAFCATDEVVRGCGTQASASLGVAFTPVWNQAFPSVDLSMPMVLVYGLKGNSGIVGGGTMPEGSYLLRVGGRLEYFAGSKKHQFDLSYTTRDGRSGMAPSLNAFGQPTGPAREAYSGLGNLRDRDYISFTYTTSF